VTFWQRRSKGIAPACEAISRIGPTPFYVSVCDTIEATYLNTLALELRPPTTLAQEIRGAVLGTCTRFVVQTHSHLHPIACNTLR